MVKRYQQEMDDMGDVMVNTTKKEKNMKTQKMAPIAEVSGVDVKSMLRKMGALKEEAPVVKDIEWGNYSTIMRVWEDAQKGIIPQVWKGLKTEELNDKLQKLVNAVRNPNPKKEEPVMKKQVVEEPKTANFGFKVVDKRRRVVEEVPKATARRIERVVEEEFMQSEEEFTDDAPVVAKDTKRDKAKARRKNMDNPAKVKQASEEAKAQMQAMEHASALASLSQFKPKEDEDKVFTVLTLETQRNGKSKVIFRGGASKFLRPIKMIFGDGMDIVAADEETVEFMQAVQKEIINIINRNQ
jgi:hypothetical protein